MADVVTAIYEKGVLKPLRPLSLRERQKVRIYLVPERDENEVERIVGLLVAAGLVRPIEKAVNPPPDPVSPAKRQELARILGRMPGKPLSEIAIEV
jgi:predicted DNA-binding antitoxin AbrB/MazE fold protein